MSVKYPKYPSILYPKTVLTVIVIFGSLNIIVNQHSYYEIGYRFSEGGFLLAGILLHFIQKQVYQEHLKLFNAFRNKLEPQKSSFETWFDNETLLIFGNPLAYLIGLALATLTVVVFFVNNPPWYGYDLICFLTYLGIFFMITGITAFLYFRVLWFLFKLNKLEISNRPLAFFDIEAKVLSTIYLKLLGSGLVLYFLTLIVLWISPGNFFLRESAEYAPQLNQMFILVKIFVFAIASFVIGFLFISQYGIHKLLVKFKNNNLGELSDQLSSAYQGWLKDPSDKNAEKITRISEWKEHIKKQDEWPINYKTVLLIMTTVILPLTNFMIDLSNNNGWA